MKLDELKRLHEAATPGPWQMKPLSMTGASLLTLPHPMQWSVQLPTENAALIAAMRNALPDMIAAAECLRDLRNNCRMVEAYDECVAADRILTRLGVE